MAKRNNSETFEQINGACGLVLGAFLNGKSSEDWWNSRAGWNAWNDPRVQAAAMRAAKSFLDEIEAAKDSGR